MSQRSGVGSYLDQNRPVGDGPGAAYLMDKSGTPGTYVLGSGKKALEATAFLKDSGSGTFILDSDSSAETRALYLIGTTTVIA